MAKRKTKKRARQPRTVPKQRISTGNAKKQVAEDCVDLAMAVLSALVEDGAEHVKNGVLPTPAQVERLGLEEGVHFRWGADAVVMDPIRISPPALLNLAGRLEVTGNLHEEAWKHLYPDSL